MTPDDEPIRITIEEAVAAARAAAFTETFDEDEDRGREPRTLVHSFTTGGLAIGADWDLEAVVEFIERSVDRAWTWTMFKHELAVVAVERMLVFDAQRDKHGALPVSDE